MIGASVFVSPYECWLVDSVGYVLMMTLTLLTSIFLFHETPELSDRGSLHLLLSAAE